MQSTSEQTVTRRPGTGPDSGTDSSTDIGTVAHGLSRVLADAYILALKTHGYHWNVSGAQFFPLHQLFEEQYQELSAATDEIAERIRAIGEPAPASYRQFSQLSVIEEDAGDADAVMMLRNLEADQRKTVATIKEALRAAEAAGDDASADLLIQRIQVHEKAAWMLGAHLQ